jgi:taurine transport system substrate-binding protein
MSLFRITRRTALAGTFASALAFSALPDLAAAQDLQTIRVGAPFGSIPGVKAAIEEGLFEREGIEIEIVTLSGGPNILAATVGGSLEIGYADIFAWVGAQENGFDLTLLQAANGRGNSDYIIAGPNSGIETPADLVGKKIGTAAHAQSKLRVQLYLERFGIDPNAVEYVIINQRETVGAALAGGQIDAAIASDPNVAQWEQQYGVRPLDGRPWEQIPERTATAGFFATGPWVAENEDLVEGFVRAAREGARLYNAYSAKQKAQITLKYDEIDLFAVEEEVPGVIERMNDANAALSGPIDVEAVQEWLDIAQSKGVIEEAIDIQPLLHPTATAETL